MPTLTNVPEDLHRRPKAVAAQNHRSLNREAIRRFEESVGASVPVRDPAREKLDALHERQRGVPLVTDDRRVLTACPGVAVSLDDFGAE